MIARIEFDYRYRDKVLELAKVPEQLAVLQSCIVGAPQGNDVSIGYMWPNDILVDLEQDGPRLTALGLEFTVKAFKGTLPLQSVLLDGKNYVVHVHVPNIGLLTVDEVMVEEDACTDNLQRRLNEGWRILCVCPPNNQRRPDYVLGRAKEDDRGRR